MKLTFRNFERDIERYLDQHGKHTTIGGHPAVRGHDKAQQYVFDAYLEAKGYDAVVDYLLTFNWEVGTNEWLRAATEAFRCARRVSNIKRLWRGVIAKQKLVFWELHAIRAEASISRKQLSAAKKLALCSMGTLRELVIELGDQRERERLNEEIDLFELEERTKVGPPTDLRKVDEGVFWDVIETTRSVSGSVADRINHLTSHLTQFRAADIRRFDKLLHEKMRQAYHWDLWALAFIAQDGCSDDAFEAFRAWLILQGRECCELALKDIRLVVERVPAGLETQAEGLRGAAAIAYEARAGKPPMPLKTGAMKLQGEPWEEENLDRRYPELRSYGTRA